MRIINILRWVLLSVLLAVLALPALAIAGTNSTVVQVDGLSMAPTFALGDVVVIRPPKSDDFTVGTVVTVLSAGHERYTHRIVDVTSDGSLILRGDGNQVDDPDPVDRADVVGVVDAHFTGVGATLVLQLQSWPLRICVLAMILGLLFMPMATRAVRAAPGRRAAISDGGTAAASASAAAAPAGPSSRRPRGEYEDEDSKQEVLDLVDSVRSSVARAILASDRRLGGSYTVTTKPGRGDFPDVRVVIDIAPKGEVANLEQPAVVAPDAASSRRALRVPPSGSDSHPIAPPVRRRDAREEPSRRSRAAQAQHGRRRAR